MRILLALVFSILATSNTLAQTLRVNVTEYGIFTTEMTEAKINAQGIRESTVKNVKLAVTTRTVPMQKNIEFGFRYELVGSPQGAKVPLRIVTVYPPPGVQPPNASQPIPRDEQHVVKTIGPLYYTAYSLEDSWEFLPGDWTLEIWYGDQKLASETFTVVKQ